MGRYQARMKTHPHIDRSGIEARSLAHPTLDIGKVSVVGRSLRPTIHRLNARAVGLLAKAGQRDGWSAGPACLREVSRLWAAASEVTLSRAARCPMVLLDFNFQCVGWWSRAVNTQRDIARSRLSLADNEEAISLARDLVLEAWSAARLLPRGASLAFGMAPEVASRMARFSPLELETWVALEVDSLRLRWESRPVFWKELFYSAEGMDDLSLESVHLHCLQLLGGELSSSGRLAREEQESLSEVHFKNFDLDQSSLV